MGETVFSDHRNHPLNISVSNFAENTFASSNSISPQTPESLNGLSATAVLSSQSFLMRLVKLAALKSSK